MKMKMSLCQQRRNVGVAVGGCRRGHVAAGPVARCDLVAHCFMSGGLASFRRLSPDNAGIRGLGQSVSAPYMPITHFGEKVRWSLDLLGVPYDEQVNGGLLSLLLTGRSVPYLTDRKSCSSIGNSDDILRFVGAVVDLSPDGKRFLERTPAAREWEEALNEFGHAIQGYCYRFPLAADPLGGRALVLPAWGAFEPRVSWVARYALRLGYPLFRFILVKAFHLHSKTANERRNTIIRTMLARVDVQLAKTAYLTGDSLSYVDVTFCSRQQCCSARGCAL